MVVKITIDANLINVRGCHDAMNKLEQLRDQGKVELVGAQRLMDEIRRHPMQPAANHKVSSMRDVNEPFVLDYSALGFGYLPEEGRPQFDEIANILFPRMDARTLNSNEANDVMHLLGHCYSNSDYFVTDDRHDFIEDGRRELLRERFGIVVMTAGEMVDHLIAT